jgi:uncharacterized protein (TIGR02246 family)
MFHPYFRETIDMSLKDQIQAAQNALAETLETLDSKEVAARYSEDAHMLPDGLPTMKGRTEISTFFDGVFKQGVVGGKFSTLEVDGTEVDVIEIGRYELYAQPQEGPRVSVGKGRYLVAWKRIDGAWFLHRDIFNSEG